MPSITPANKSAQEYGSQHLNSAFTTRRNVKVFILRRERPDVQFCTLFYNCLHHVHLRRSLATFPGAVVWKSTARTETVTFISVRLRRCVFDYFSGQMDARQVMLT